MSDDAWEPWRPAQLADRLRSVAIPWYVTGGWALDLWHGSQTREHGDLEFAVLAEDVAQFRKVLSGLDFFTAHDGKLAHLPAETSPPSHVSQLWGLDAASRCWRVDMMIERGTTAEWVYKRDPSLRRPRAEVVRRTAEGIPYLAPAVVLLFKAKHRREKDEVDFLRALPKLGAAERKMLREWLEYMHPGHAWLDGL